MLGENKGVEIDIEVTFVSGNNFTFLGIR